MLTSASFGVSSSSGIPSAKSRARATGNTKGRAPAKSADPIQVACTLRRKSLKDFNKVPTTLKTAVACGEAALAEALVGLWLGVVVMFCDI